MQRKPLLTSKESIEPKQKMAEHLNQTAFSGGEEGQKQGGITPDTIPAIVLLLFILLLNGCVLLLFSCYSYLKTTSNLILASLALSDFLVGLVGIPLVVVCTATFIAPICLSSSTFWSFVSLSTVGHITVMTCDRYIYILWALRYREIVTRGRVLIVLGIIWFIGFAFSLVRLAWMANLRIETAKEHLARNRKNEIIYLSFNAAFFFIPLVLMVVLDVQMMLLLRRQCQRIRRENLPAEFVKRESKVQNRQKRAVLTCILLLVLYVVFWLPYFILEFAQHASEHPEGQPSAVIVPIYYLRFCTSLFNPILYTLRKHDLKRTTKSLIRRVCSCLRRDAVENNTEQIPLSSLV